jgi:hypothetical protein
MREWRTANGLSGYASGTACGANTCRHHGLLVAALAPPGRRTIMLSCADATVGSVLSALAEQATPDGGRRTVDEAPSARRPPRRW